MRKTTTLVGLVAAVCAFGVSAVPAMAHQFVGSKTGKLTGKGFEEIAKVARGEFREYNPERMQQFHFGQFQINCYTEASSGELTENPTEVLTVNMKFSSCRWYPNPNKPIGVTANWGKEGVTVKFHANGFVETLENGEEMEYKGEILPTSAEVKVQSKVCRIAIPAQTIPVRAIKHPEEEFSTVLYSNFTMGTREMILFTNAWKAIKFRYETKEGEEVPQQCSNPENNEKLAEEGAATGKYTGQTYVKLVGGNLKWE